jgi:hypothetical protein
MRCVHGEGSSRLAWAGVALCICLVVSSFWVAKRQQSKPLLAALPALLQIAGNQELAGEDLRDFCDNEMHQVSSLLEVAPTLDGEALLWTCNQMDSRLINVAYFS